MWQMYYTWYWSLPGRPKREKNKLMRRQLRVNQIVPVFAFLYTEAVLLRTPGRAPERTQPPVTEPLPASE